MSDTARFGSLTQELLRGCTGAGVFALGRYDCGRGRVYSRKAMPNPAKNRPFWKSLLIWSIIAVLAVATGVVWGSVLV